MNWRLFVGASILGAGLLLKAGAPILPVVLGIALAGWFNHLRVRANTPRPPKSKTGAA